MINLILKICFCIIFAIWMGSYVKSIFGDDRVTKKHIIVSILMLITCIIHVVLKNKGLI